MTEEDLIRFYDKVVIEPNTYCWLWTGALSAGYGSMSVRGRFARAHRLAYEHFRGPIADGLNVCHKCDVRACCNPDHLFLGTQKQNMIDCAKKGRAGSTKLSSEDAAAIRRMRRNGIRRSDIAALFGVHRRTISRVANGRRASD